MFIEAIADVERGKLQEKLDAAKFVTVLSDGSTDVSAIENEVIYIRFSLQGRAENYFIAMQDVKRADAQGIYNALVKHLENFNILHKIVAFAADGASVNTGENNGVIAKIRKHVSPSVIMVKCLAHRLELAFKEAVSELQPYNNTFVQPVQFISQKSTAKVITCGRIQSKICSNSHPNWGNKMAFTHSLSIGEGLEGLQGVYSVS